MSSRVTTLLALAVAIAAIAVGCGSSSGGPTSSEGASSSTSETQRGSEAQSGSGEGGTASADKEAFVKQATAACEREREEAIEKLGAYQAKHRKEGLSASELSEDAVTAVFLSTVEAEIAALRKLEPPAGEEQRVEAILASLDKDLEKAKKKAATASSNEVENSFADASRELALYGLSSCAK